MEGLIFIGFLAFIALVFFKPNAGSKIDPNKKGLDRDGNYDIPEALRVKWNGQDLSSSSAAKKRMMTAAFQSTARQTLQSRRSDARNKAQRKEFTQSGDGVPLDKNPNRRDDWGREGGMGSGWFMPFIVSSLVAGGIAAFFTTT
jgi:hypothetical protein